MPTFNKKEEVFSTLCEFAVPMTKAAWFIKMFAAYNVAVQEKMKQRRHLVDQSMGNLISQRNTPDLLFCFIIFFGFKILFSVYCRVVSGHHKVYEGPGPENPGAPLRAWVHGGVPYCVPAWPQPGLKTVALHL